MAPSGSIRVAAIDCGTNTLRLLIADVNVSAGVKADVFSRMDVVRLGEAVDENGTLSEAAIDRVVATCRELRNDIDRLAPEVVRFCATSAVRDAANREEFCDRIEEVLGSRPVVLSGDEEAAAAFEGVTRELGAHGRTAVIDLGGGSTEVVVADGAEVTWARSFNIGSVRLTERYLLSDPPTPAQVDACTEYVDQLIARPLESLAAVDTVVGVAGSITTIAAVALKLPAFDASAMHLAPVPMPELRKTGRRLVCMSADQRRELPVMHPGRADVIGAGAIVLDRVLEHLPSKTDLLTVSARDILDGIAWQAARAAK